MGPLKRISHLQFVSEYLLHAFDVKSFPSAFIVIIGASAAWFRARQPLGKRKWYFQISRTAFLGFPVFVRLNTTRHS